MAKKNLYTTTGEPKRIRCYMQKVKKSVDYITIVFTYAHYAGYPIGTVLYRAMNDLPFHPAYGFAQWGEGNQCSFRPGGSRVAFVDLPNDCKELIMRDYKDLWENGDE